MCLKLTVQAAKDAGGWGGGSRHRGEAEGGGRGGVRRQTQMNLHKRGKEGGGFVLFPAAFSGES